LNRHIVRHFLAGILSLVKFKTLGQQFKRMHQCVKLTIKRTQMQRSSTHKVYVKNRTIHSRAGMGNLFTITGRMNCAMSLQGRKN